MESQPELRHGRHPERGVSDRVVIDAILDSQRICHLAFTLDGWPYAVPTIHARDGDRLLVHGSTLSRMLVTLAAATPVCVTVTAVDGIVAARSAFNHSLNYRSVMVFGRATAIEESEEKLHALRLIVDHVLPGRWDEVRTPSRNELRATQVVWLPLDRVTAKVRSGPSVDAPADRTARVWSGVVPLMEALGTPVLVPDDVADLPVPPSVTAAIERARP